jgi:hypothetical protein
LVQVIPEVQPAMAAQSAQTVSLLPLQTLLAYLPAGHGVQATHVPPAR